MSKTVPLYEAISYTLDALQRSKAANRADNPWPSHWARLLTDLEKLLPSGAGFDCGSKVDRSADAPTRSFKIMTDWHNMNDAGFYDGWFNVEVGVEATFSGFVLDVRIFGAVSDFDAEQLADHVHEVFYEALSQDVSLGECIDRIVQEDREAN